jgi:hypothetical protein
MGNAQRRTTKSELKRAAAKYNPLWDPNAHHNNIKTPKYLLLKVKKE